MTARCALYNGCTEKFPVTEYTLMATFADIFNGLCLEGPWEVNASAKFAVNFNTALCTVMNSASLNFGIVIINII